MKLITTLAAIIVATSLFGAETNINKTVQAQTQEERWTALYPDTFMRQMEVIKGQQLVYFGTAPLPMVGEIEEKGHFFASPLMWTDSLKKGEKIEGNGHRTIPDQFVVINHHQLLGTPNHREVGTLNLYTNDSTCLKVVWIPSPAPAKQSAQK